MVEIFCFIVDSPVDYFGSDSGFNQYLIQMEISVSLFL